MLIVVESRCPKCGNMVGSLQFWKQLGDKYFYLCEICVKSQITIDEALIIGHHFGETDFKEKVLEWLREPKEK